MDTTAAGPREQSAVLSGARTTPDIQGEGGPSGAATHEPGEAATRMFVLYHGPASDDAPRNTETFTNEIEAREGLALLRSSPVSMSQWAELVRIGPGSPVILAWFGRPSPRFTRDKIAAWSCNGPREL